MSEIVEANINPDEFKKQSKCVESADNDKAVVEEENLAFPVTNFNADGIDDSKDTISIESVDDPPVSENSVKSGKRKRPYTFKCSFCGKAFQAPSKLKRHAMSHTGEKPYECSICKAGFSSKQAVEHHQTIHTGEKPVFKCDECPKTFTVRGRLSAHKRFHSGDLRFVCDVCGKAFSIASKLKKHERTHSKDQPFGCTVCGKLSKNIYSFRSHQLSHTDASSTQGKPHECSICKKRFSSISHFKYHLSVHTGEKPFKCDECPKSFAIPGLLAAHKRVHSGGSLFTCGVCGKSFSIMSKLKLHESTHTKDLPFSCSVCGKHFKTKHALKNHGLNHTDMPKDFECENCGRSFHLLYQLNAHKRQYARKHNKCRFCKKRFVTVENLRQHERSVHASTENYDHSELRVDNTDYVKCAMKVDQSSLVVNMKIKEECGLDWDSSHQSEHLPSSENARRILSENGSKSSDSAFEFIALSARPEEIVCDAGPEPSRADVFIKIEQEDLCEEM